MNAEEFYNRINNGQKREDPGNEDLFLLIAMVTYSKGVFLSVNPKTDFRSKNEFRVPFGKSKSGFLIWWILFEKGFTGFEIRRIQIQINGLVIYVVPFTMDPKLVRWSSGIFSWSIPTEAVEFPRCFHLPQNIWKH